MLESALAVSVCLSGVKEVAQFDLENDSLEDGVADS
jgi:hypothetical protein